MNFNNESDIEITDTTDWDWHDYLEHDWQGTDLGEDDENDNI